MEPSRTAHFSESMNPGALRRVVDLGGCCHSVITKYITWHLSSSPVHTNPGALEPDNPYVFFLQKTCFLFPKCPQLWLGQRTPSAKFPCYWIRGIYLSKDEHRPCFGDQVTGITYWIIFFSCFCQVLNQGGCAGGTVWSFPWQLPTNGNCCRCKLQPQS